MKVCLYNLTTTTQYGGVESFVWEVARELAARGVDTTVVGGDGPVRRPYTGVKVVTFPYVSRVRLRSLPGMGKQFTWTKLLERLSMARNASRFMANQGFDIIHLQKPYDLAAAGWIVGQPAARVILGCHGTDFFPGDRRFVKAAAAAVSCSAYNAAQVEEHFGVTPRVVYNGIDPAQFAPRPADRELRHRLVGDAPAILYVGRLVRWKGVQYLIEALTYPATAGAHLLIAGEGEYRERLEARARECGVAPRVHFLGYIPPEELAAYYALADVVAVASYANETFSIMAAEAMACARPVVGSRFGGIPEVIVDGETGLGARPEDPADLAEQLGRVLANPALAARFGAAGRARALELFTWEAVTTRVLEVYRDVLRDRGDPVPLPAVQIA